MQLVINIRKSPRENAAVYFEEAKKYKEKTRGAKLALARTENELLAARSEFENQVQTDSESKVIRKAKKPWYSSYIHFKTSSGLIVIGGRSAKQNDQVYAKYLQEGDLFMHADIRGSPAVIIKEGEKNASEQDLKEAAQFTASFSSAWKRGLGNTDVYCVPAGQVDKHSTGEYVAKGGFMIRGERKYLRDTPVGLYCSSIDGTFAIFPKCHSKLPKERIEIQPGELEKTRTAKTLKYILEKKIGTKVESTEEEIVQLLPGECKIVN